jgi:RimJ/RimL family protein N-acetyltransferase
MSFGEGREGHACLMEFGDEAAIDAWRRLAGAPSDARLRVVVNAESWLAPPGWIGVVAIGDAITASVPRAELRAPVERALAALGGKEATDPEILMSRLTPTTAALGPAQLFYPPRSFEVAGEPGDEATSGELSRLLAASHPEDLDESGLAHIESPAFVSRSYAGAVVSASGYRRWPNGVAHLSVLTHPDHRRRLHGRRAAAAAVRHAVAEGLLPQWRARPLPSQRLALTIGFVHMGAQLSVQPA